VLALLQDSGLPIASARLLVDTACHWLVVTVQQGWRETNPGVESSELIHRIGQAMSANRVGRMCPVTYVLDDDIDPTSIDDVLWALGTRVHPNLRQESWEVTILPWYLCYTDHERHTAKGSIVVHDCLLPQIDDPRVKPATFDSQYPAELRNRILANESRPR
jgi:4-hydroxy-3-polyprenylbenzoate decarboxylase